MSRQFDMSKWICLGLSFVATIATAQERSVRISFVPPPLDGTISLGVYNDYDQLVRVLHQEATFDEFTVGPDSLITKWDGKDDYGYDLPTGKYSARGFLVAEMKVEELTAPTETPSLNAAQSITVRLVPNPLQKAQHPTVELSASIDDEDLLLRTSDGLPLTTIAQIAGAKSATVASERDPKVLTVLVSNGNATRRFSVSGINRMMAFDCGEFQLK